MGRRVVLPKIRHLDQPLVLRILKQHRCPRKCQRHRCPQACQRPGQLCSLRRPIRLRPMQLVCPQAFQHHLQRACRPQPRQRCRRVDRRPTSQRAHRRRIQPQDRCLIQRCNQPTAQHCHKPLRQQSRRCNRNSRLQHSNAQAVRKTRTAHASRARACAGHFGLRVMAIPVRPAPHSAQLSPHQERLLRLPLILWKIQWMQ
mmetsp:Transcript_22272/g.63145  ORF Transcript_22272/g.63145 Transcript_22272/m.63145 type:complete len:201 (+) Transcript_22272:1434-2036(+)